MKKILIFSTIIYLVGCKKNEAKQETWKTYSQIKYKAQVEAHKRNTETKEVHLKNINDEIIHILKIQNYGKFAQFIHPEKGIRFSMYGFMNAEDKHFSKTDFQKYHGTKMIFTWGTRDGSGEIYQSSISEYLKNWVFVKDFTESEFSFNQFQGHGNSLNNLKEVYPKNDFTENFIKGTEKYSGMDWNTLRFVFENFEGKFYLVAVINDQWTI